MDRIPVASSSIASIGYDEVSVVLEIEFVHGGVYQYFGVPEHVYQELMGASSMGAYFHNQIRNGFSTAKVS